MNTRPASHTIRPEHNQIDGIEFVNPEIYELLTTGPEQGLGAHVKRRLPGLRGRHAQG